MLTSRSVDENADREIAQYMESSLLHPQFSSPCYYYYKRLCLLSPGWGTAGKSFGIIGGSWQIFREKWSWQKIVQTPLFSCCADTKYECLCFLEIFQNPCAINVGECLSYVSTTSLFLLSILWGFACCYFGFWVNTWNLLEVHCLQISHHAPFFPRGKPFDSLIKQIYCFSFLQAST